MPPGANTSAPDLLGPAAELVGLLPEPSYLLADSTRIIAANQAAATLSGFARRDLLGRELHTLVVDGDKLRLYLLMCARSKQLVPGGAQWMAGDGTVVDIRCDGAVLIPRSGQQGAVVFLRCRPRVEATDHFQLLNRKIAELSHEVLQRRKAEQSRDELLVKERMARMQAEEDSRLKDEFLATLSHELRTPLSSILLWTHLLQHQGLPATATEGLTVIERNARVQTRLVEDLLDMSRIGVGKVRLDVQPVNLVTVVESAIEAVRPAADAKRLRLQTTLDPAAGTIKGDPNRLLQVFWNLLSNAVKFSTRDGGIPVVLERVDSKIVVTVSDTGEGIAPSFLPHVFDRFRQEDATITRRHGGLGLGLSIVRELTELHGGEVRAASPGVGRGATFVVSFPVAALQLPSEPRSSHPPDSNLPAASTEPHQAPASLTGLHVLVVDDDADSRRVVAILLEARGARVTCASSAAEALDAIAGGVPDVVISDLGMPGEDGFQLMQRIRRLPADRGGQVPAIALSAFARSADRTRAMLAGFHIHLSKPVDSSELTAAVASVARRRP